MNITIAVQSGGQLICIDWESCAWGKPQYILYVHKNVPLVHLMQPYYIQCCITTLTSITDESTIKVVSPDIAATA